MNARSPSRAAEIAARQVESIVRAAETAAEGVRTEARRESERLRGEAEAEAQSIRAGALREADRHLEEVRKKVGELEREGRREVAQRISEAQQAADEMLAEARAVHSGLRQLGTALSNHAERILRDVQASHRRMTGELRLPGAGSPDPAAPASAEAGGMTPAEAAALRRAVSDTEPPEERRSTARGRASGRQAPRSDGFDGIEVPDWVDPNA